MSYRATIHFDGHCLLCSRVVHFIIRHDKRRRFCFRIQPDPQSRITKGTTVQDLAPGSVILHQNGVVYRESDAVLRILIGLGLPWNLLGIFMLIPSVFRNKIYRIVSVNRYRWFGRSRSCFVPGPNEAERFK